LGRYLDATGGLDQAVAVLRRGLRAVGAESTAERSRLLSALAYTLVLSGEPSTGDATLEEAAAIAEALDDDRLRADVLASRTSLEFATGRMRECIVTADAAERALSAGGQLWDAVQAQVTTLWPRLWLGRVADARRHGDHVVPVAERIGHLPAIFLARRSAALLDLVTGGDVERFAAYADEGVELCRSARLRWLADAHVFAGLARFWRGVWDAASGHLRAAATAPAPPIYTGRYSATLLIFLAWTGDAVAFDALLDDIGRGIASLGVDRTLGSIAVTLAEVEGHALLGRDEAAAALYPDVTALLDEGLALRPPDLRVLHALAGLAAGLGGDLETADGHFAEARRLVAALPHPRQAPDIDFLHGLALLGRHPERARPLLSEATAGYEALSMPGHRARAEALRTLGRPARAR
jgi:hypothetical protein